MIKETRHPPHCIDLRIVPFSMKIDKELLEQINKDIVEKYGDEYTIPLDHHVLLVDMGENK